MCVMGLGREASSDRLSTLFWLEQVRARKHCKSKPYCSKSSWNCFHSTMLTFSYLVPRDIAIRRNSTVYLTGVLEELDPFYRFPFTRTHGRNTSSGRQTCVSLKKLVGSHLLGTTNPVMNYVSALQCLWELDVGCPVNLYGAFSLFLPAHLTPT